MKNNLFMITIILICIVGTGCGQETITLPETPGGGGECGYWYPGSISGDTDSAQEDTDSENQTEYGMNPGETAPCMVWESVRQGPYAEPTSTHLNLDDMYLSYSLENYDSLKNQFGVPSSSPTPLYLVFISSAINCPECKSYMIDISENQDMLTGAGILPVGVGNNDLWSQEKGLDVIYSEALLEEDHWPEQWLRTNDEVDNITTAMAAWPTTIGIRIQDMKVLINGATLGSTEGLIEELERQSDLFPLAEDESGI